MRAASWRLRDGDLVGPVELGDVHVHALGAMRSGGSCRRSRGGSAARGGRGRRARRAGRAPGGRSRTARRSRRGPCGRCRARRRRARPCGPRAGTAGGSSGPPAPRACRGRRGRRRCRSRRAGSSVSSRSETSRCRRRARCAPRRWMPTRATWPSGFFSTISCAIRTSVRRTSSSSRTTLGFVIGSFLASRGRVKGTRLEPSSAGRRSARARWRARPARCARAAAPGPGASGRRAAASWCSAMRSSDHAGLSWITNSRSSPASAA